MMTQNTYLIVARNLIVQLPLIAVLVVGLVVSCLRWEQSRGVSLLATIALSLMVITVVGSQLLSLWLIKSSSGASGDAIALQWMLFASRLALNVLMAVALAFLLCAVFGWRDKHSPGDSSSGKPRKETSAGGPDWDYEA